MGLTTHTQTVICTQETEVFILDQRNYERLLEKKNPQTIEKMRYLLHEKLDLRLSWHPEKELPLLRFFLYKLDEKERMKNRKNAYNTSHEPLSRKNWKIENVRRGPFINAYGPGSLYYSIKMRERNRQNMLNSVNAPPGLTNYRRPIRVSKPRSPPMRSFYELRTALKASLTRGEDELPNRNGLAVNFGGTYIEHTAKMICESGFFMEEEENSEDDFRDWPSSDGALAHLEGRIQAWHESIDEGTRHLNRTVKLKRFLPIVSKPAVIYS